MNRIGRSEINFGEHRSLSASLEKIEAVTLDEVNAVARKLLTKSYGAAVLGPRMSKRSLRNAFRASQANFVVPDPSRLGARRSCGEPLAAMARVVSVSRVLRSARAVVGSAAG